jgi:hypothetical protein
MRTLNARDEKISHTFSYLQVIKMWWYVEFGIKGVRTEHTQRREVRESPMTRISCYCIT